jgi:SAM-dependent methyltransferase
MTAAINAFASPGLPGHLRPLCLLCGREVEILMDFGTTGLANNLPGRDELGSEPVFPLRLARCSHCSHVQLADTVDPARLYERYLYVSSASSTLREHLSGLAAAVLGRTAPPPGSLCVDIGSNDGTLASRFHRAGHLAVGVDPAENLSAMARAKGVEAVVDYFGRRTAGKLRERYGQARIITATNSFPHIPDVEDYLEGVRTLLHPEGAFVIEAHYLLDLIESCAFDTVYHEHCHYWRLEPMAGMFRRFGLEAYDCERLPVHHGQLRVWVQHRGARPVSDRVRRTIDAEAAAGLRERGVFELFAQRAKRIRSELREALDDCRRKGLRVAGYGAPAKASTLAAWCALTPQDIAWIADRNPLKHGRHTPGTHIPVVDVARIESDPPDVLLLFAWNFADEIAAQLEEFRAAGGRFLIPIPEVRFV